MLHLNVLECNCLHVRRVCIKMPQYSKNLKIQLWELVRITYIDFLIQICYSLSVVIQVHFSMHTSERLFRPKFIITPHFCRSRQRASSIAQLQSDYYKKDSSKITFLIKALNVLGFTCVAPVFRPPVLCSLFVPFQRKARLCQPSLTSGSGSRWPLNPQRPAKILPYFSFKSLNSLLFLG